MEVVLFRPPQSMKQVLLVWGIPDTLPWECKWHELERTFHRFGPLYSIYVPDGGRFAIVKYYSHHAAMSAVKCTDRKATIGHSVIKVTLSSVDPCRNEWPLHISKCHKLANHYLHFNGWTIRILMLEEQGNGSCRCTVELKIRGFQVCVRGLGVMETQNDCIQDVQGYTKKAAFHRACENAFSQVGIVLSPQGVVTNVAVI